MLLQKVKDLTRKADSGMSSVTDGIVLMVAIVVSTILIFVGLSNYTNMIAVDDVTMIARQCIISMETEGYLSTENEGRTRNQLEQAGCTDIDFHTAEADSQKTTNAPVLFGNQITLHLTVSVPRRSIEIQGISLAVSQTQLPMNIVLTSTAKS